MKKHIEPRAYNYFLSIIQKLPEMFKGPGKSIIHFLQKKKKKRVLIVVQH